MPKKTKTKNVEPAPVANQDEETATAAESSSAAPKTSSAKLPEPVVTKSGPPAKRPIPMWVWYVAGGVVVLGIAIAIGWTVFGGNSTATTNTTATNTTNSTTLIPRALDGVLVEPDRANTNIFAVMIENINESRPPSGLDQASVVYETLAEGGITRFLALYPVGDNLHQIGPVRSARPYFISWAEDYKPLFVHAGGSPQALTYLQSGKANVYDFNQFRYGGNFIRDDTRAAPHNLYTDSEKLFLGLRRVAPDATPTYTPWTFIAETPLDSRPQAVNDLTLNFSSFNYKVTYKYDRVLNNYQRFIAEKPHITRDNVQITAKNVVVLYTKINLISGEKQRLEIETVGTGKLLLFQSGIVTEGTWKKDSATARLQFLDAAGTPLGLNTGPTWIEIGPANFNVQY